MKKQTITNQITRQDYLDKKVSHQEYYETLAKIAGISFSDSFIERVKSCLNAGDEHLNSILLQVWDSMGSFDRTNPYLRAELKKRNDGLSLSCSVCMRKAMAKSLADRS